MPVRLRHDAHDITRLFAGGKPGWYDGPFPDGDVDQWIQAAVYLAVCLALPVGMLGVASLLRVRAKAQPPTKFDTYECGEEPDGVAWVRFHPRYYVIALIFVLFDVEAAFLFPWALGLRDLGLLAIVEMAIFVGVLLAGWAYALRKGALEWQ